MNDSVCRVPDSEVSVGRSHRAPDRRPGSGTHPRASLGDTRGGTACGICTLTLQPGHREVHFPCGQWGQVLHANRGVETLRKARNRHPSTTQESTVEPTTRDRTR